MRHLINRPFFNLKHNYFTDLWSKFSWEPYYPKPYFYKKYNKCKINPNKECPLPISSSHYCNECIKHQPIITTGC
jgi:hypothetical protein